jgi:hypothetical protein
VFSIRPNLSEFQVHPGIVFGHCGENLRERRKIQQIPVSNCRKDRYNLAERAIHPTDSQAMATICKHPKVRIVSRHEDTEYVECMECGEVFDSDEFRDMELEETAEPEEAKDE